MLKILIFTLQLIVLINLVLSDRTKDKIYENVIGHMCFRRLNSTHQTGCTSAMKPTGSVGVLHLVSKEDDLTFILSNPPAPPYAAILTPKLFTRENILKLRDSEFISAIVLINDTFGLETFSQESKCPNNFYRHSKQPVCDVTKPETTWNPFGTGLLNENFDIPIIFLSDKNESDKVVKCFNDFNRNFAEQSSRSLCSIEINSFMSAAGNSEVCLRRSRTSSMIRPMNYCDPLQGKNVYGTLFPREIVNPDNRTNDKNEKFILISARLDTTSMFDGIALGAMDSLASVATIISTAHFLRKIIPSSDAFEKQNLNVLFMFFNGESYDYIGSQRFVYDLKNGSAFPSSSSYTRPLTLDNIIMMIDVGSLDSLDTLSVYHVNESVMASRFVTSMQRYNSDLGLSVTITNIITNNIPPVSAQTFLRENLTFPAFVLASQKPENKFYHSIYDDAKNIKFVYHNTSKDFDQLDSSKSSSDFSPESVQVKIRNIATLLGLGIYDLLMEGKNYSSSSVASSALVDEFLYCYLVATKCRLFDSVFVFPGEYRGSNYPPQRYVSVQASVLLEATGWAYRVLGFALGSKTNDAKENCTTLPHYWIPGSLKTGECRLTTQNFSFAISPAFEEEGYNFASNKYSTWTESTWNDLSARIFLRPSASHQSFTFAIGLSVLILSFFVIYFINANAEILFGGAINAEHVSLPAQC